VQLAGLHTLFPRLTEHSHLASGTQTQGAGSPVPSALARPPARTEPPHRPQTAPGGRAGAGAGTPSAHGRLWSTRRPRPREGRGEGGRGRRVSRQPPHGSVPKRTRDLGSHLQAPCWRLPNTGATTRARDPLPPPRRGAPRGRAPGPYGGARPSPPPAGERWSAACSALPSPTAPSAPQTRAERGELDDARARSGLGEVQARAGGRRGRRGRTASRRAPGPSACLCVCTHWARGGARGRGERAPANGSAGGGAGAGRAGPRGRGRAFPPLCVIGWRAARGGALREGASLGVSHLSIVFAAAAAPPPLSNASAASRSLSSSRRRRGVSFPVCPRPRNRARLPPALRRAVGAGAAPTAPLARPGKLFGPEMEARSEFAACLAAAAPRLPPPQPHGGPAAAELLPPPAPFLRWNPARRPPRTPGPRRARAPLGGRPRPRGRFRAGKGRNRRRLHPGNSLSPPPRSCELHHLVSLLWSPTIFFPLFVSSPF
jgi:hypothetical protein